MSDFDVFAVLDLYTAELESHTQTLTQGLLALEKEPTQTEPINELLRAAHSLKGAARLMGITGAEKVAHAMEELFSASQEGLVFAGPHVDTLLEGVDLLRLTEEIKDRESLQEWTTRTAPRIEDLVGRLTQLLDPDFVPAASPESEPEPEPESEEPEAEAEIEVPEELQAATASRPSPQQASRTLRLAADRLDALMGMAGEIRVSARWLGHHSGDLVRIKVQQMQLGAALTEMLDLVSPELDLLGKTRAQALKKMSRECVESLTTSIEELEEFDRRMFGLSNSLHREVVASRMRPFADVLGGHQRMVRDLARQRKKKAELVIEGHETPVDRDILEKVEAPLTHLLRNACDHGLESAAARKKAGKPARGTIRLEANHRGGMLCLSVSDDGGGIDHEKLRKIVVKRGLVTKQIAAQLDHKELTDFLFLPSFSTRTKADEISGRGVGLDVVHSVVQELGGRLNVESTLGQGTRFELLLPITLSVVRSLLVRLQSELYAFPLSRIEGVLRIGAEEVESIEGRPHVRWSGDQLIGVIRATRLLDLPAGELGERLHIVVLGDRQSRFALVVDSFEGEQSLVVQTLDRRLGKLKNLACGALTEEGEPILVFDVEDLKRSYEKLWNEASLEGSGVDTGDRVSGAKRVLVVEDSITVREVERQLLELQGYQVDVAVDGMDGWNAVRGKSYDLVVSDVDMPRMDGFQLVESIKQDPKLSSIPVIIVSYKDREADRLRGMEVGADYYLTKGSFQDDSFIKAVRHLIGEGDS